MECKLGWDPWAPQSLKMGVRGRRTGTYFPAVQTSNESEGTNRGSVQPHVVPLQDKVVQPQAV